MAHAVGSQLACARWPAPTQAIVEVETPQAALDVAKEDDGAPESDGVTFEAIEAQAHGPFLRQIQDKLRRRATRHYRCGISKSRRMGARKFAFCRFLYP